MSTADILWCRHCTDSQGKRKHSYRTEFEAEAALTEAKIRAVLRHNQRRRETRKYACPVSSWWHLSSADEAEVALRQAEQARRKVLLPYVQALQAALDGSPLAGHGVELAALLHDNGWTPPARRAQRAA